MEELEFDEIKIRASYLNYFMVNLYAEKGREVFQHDSDEPNNKYDGNKPGTVVYKLKGDKTLYEIPPRWYDVYYLLSHTDINERKHYLSLLIEEQRINKGKSEGENVVPELEMMRDNLKKECEAYCKSHTLYDNDNVVNMLSAKRSVDDQRLTINNISHKGNILLEMAQKCYSVPDFSIVTSDTFDEEASKRVEYIHQAIENLEIMTRTKLGSRENPLVFAIRSAMPQYIPGLMPTMLNIGVTHQAYEGLCDRLGKNMAGRIYLNNLYNVTLLKSLDINDINKKYSISDPDFRVLKDKELSPEQIAEKIAAVEELISSTEDGDKIINDAFYQVIFIAKCIRKFYDDNQDLILTFMQGKKAYPALILQKMVWTIGNDYSYPGVIHSFHSRTGKGRQVESYLDIFGEEIMTGDISSNDMEYEERKDIRDEYPAIYHFDPLLRNLEKRYQSPVTIEFAVETHDDVSLFAILQLNKSELTGRAALLSSIKLYDEKVIPKEKVVELIRPYHLRQIVSDTIDNESFKNLKFFGKGVNVLPRTATTARLCFSSQQANEYKRQGDKACLCKERFIPEDTIILNEIDAILSMTPAAIHVVTACRGYGIPAFLNLQSNGITMHDNELVNSDGLVIKEGDWITLSSKRQSIFKGQANYRPARFMKYLAGEKVDMYPKEEKVFVEMRDAYKEYQKIVNSTTVNYISDIDTLARLIRNDFNESPEKAMSIVNEWYMVNSDNYVDQVLSSKMGSHQDQSRVYELLDTDKKVDFYRRAIKKCLRNDQSGLSAGSFMLGRFVAKPVSHEFWDNLTPKEIAFILNEYVLYEKYLQVLEEVGETKLTRVHSRIATEGFDFSITCFDLNNFIPLIITHPDWNAISQEVAGLHGENANTEELVKRLSQPPEVLFDLSKPWEKAKFDELAKM